MICSLFPLLLVGWGINIHYTRAAKSRAMNSFQTQLEHHRKIVELFLKERTSKLCIIAQSHSRDYLAEESNLNDIFKMMNREDGSFTDLGVIDAHGGHLAYIGPFDLLDKNYSREFWFKEVMERGIYISDMFMGFRKVPHFIIAILRSEKGEKWILRATIDTEVFRSLVEDVGVGKTGEVFLLNRQGVFQTSPKFSGKIMEKTPFPLEPFDEGIKIRIINYGEDNEKQRFPRQITGYTWLNEPRWMLMIRQDYAEALNDVNHANYVTLIFLHTSAIVILIVTVLVTRHMIAVIKKRDFEADRMNEKFIQASKLASIGELSVGVAHEINNPLAIIAVEKQILADMEKQTQTMDPKFRARLVKSLSQIDKQIQRCKRLTHNLLRFSRRTQPMIQTVDLNAFIKEVIELMEKEAGTSGVKIIPDMEENLPAVVTDPSQLQQVFLNLITNAVDAHDEKPYGSIRISTRSNDTDRIVRIVFADTGSGISPENMEKIFDPFFTTKPVGRGTGLGLSICYSIVRRLGGDISVRSEIGSGTEFTIVLPYNPPPELKESIGDGNLA
ncbi:MAG: ATP-binding protein [bacterium]